MEGFALQRARNAALSLHTANESGLHLSELYLTYTDVGMSLDDATANDATLIDDDLVASLGFEPTTTIEPVAGDVLDVRSDIAEFVSPEETQPEETQPEETVAEVIDLDDASTDLEDDLEDAFEEPADSSENDLLAEAAIIDDDAADTEPSEDLLVDDDIADDDLADDDIADDDLVDSDIVDDALADEEDDDPLFGSIDTPLVASFDDLDVIAADTADDLPAVEAEIEIELFDVADDDDLGDDVIDLVTDDLDVPEDLDLSGRDADETAFVARVDDASITSVPDDAASLAEFDDVFAPAPDQSVPEAVTTTVPVVGAATAIASAGKRRGKLRARKVRRVIRHVDPWSVLTFSVLFHLVFFSSMLLASILVWNGAVQAGTIDNIENFIRELGDYETFNINSDVVFRAAVVIAGMLTLASSIIVVLLTVVFNLVSDLVGGIRVTVIEEDTVVVPSGE